MKKLSKKQIIFLSVIVLIAIVTEIVIMVIKNRPNTKTSFDGEKATEVVELKKVEFSNITKKYESGITTIVADILSNDKEKKSLTIEIILKDNEGKEIDRMKQVIDDIEPGRKKRLQTAILGDYTNITDVEFEVLEEN